MVYKFSFFIGAAISSFFDNGLKFSWDRANKQYKRTLYFNGHIDKLNKDFFQTINNLKKDEVILLYSLDTHLDVSYHSYIYTKDDFWSFVKLEDMKPTYQYIPIIYTNFEEKMILLEKPKIINQSIINIKDIPHFIKTKELKNSTQDELSIFRDYILLHLFKSPYKAEN